VTTQTNSQSGFFILPRAGDVLATSSGLHCFRLEHDGRWANLMLGLRVSGSSVVDGVWGSTDDGIAQPHPYLNLRNIVRGVPYMEMQALKLFEHEGQVYAVLGCPGGRVRVVRPGAYNIGSGSHSIGTVAASSPDLGHGGAALAVRATAFGADIYFGVFTHHAPPLNTQQTSLGDADVLTGAIHQFSFTVGNPGSLSLVRTIELPPNAPGIGARGGFGVMGMCLADVLPDTGDELIVTTIAGDLFVYNTTTWSLLYRTWVAGALGNYNSIIVKDCEPTIPGPEIYVAGSMGIHRFCRRP
jgi:hypothetical protein